MTGTDIRTGRGWDVMDPNGSGSVWGAGGAGGAGGDHRSGERRLGCGRRRCSRDGRWAGRVRAWAPQKCASGSAASVPAARSLSEALACVARSCVILFASEKSS